MEKYAGIVIGAIVVLLGVAGLLRWPHAFLAVVKGTLPPILILCGAIAVIAGLSEMKDEAAAQKEAKK